MTDVQQQAKNSTAATLARLERLSGRFPVLSSENRQHYEELLICLLEHYRPRNFLGERLIKYLADEEWETSRYKRHKILLIERRFRARLAFQAYREEAAKENKAALANKLAEHRGQFVLPEEALEGVVAEVDAMLLRPAEELEHARALEVASVYFAYSTGCSTLPLCAAMPFSLKSIATTIRLIRPPPSLHSSRKCTNPVSSRCRRLCPIRRPTRELASKDRGQSGQRPKEPRTAYYGRQIQGKRQCVPAWARCHITETIRDFRGD
jgi:hypothetical protein